MKKNGYVYMLTNLNSTVIYIGVTHNLERRVLEHKRKLVKGFTQRYNLNKLIYFEQFPAIYDAIKREKQLKNWHRNWKINLINSINPAWEDLGQIPK